MIDRFGKNETTAERVERKYDKKCRNIAVARGLKKADLVLKNATYLNVFSNELCNGDIAISNGLIVGLGEYSGEVEHDMTGKIVIPGLIDAHIHLESSLCRPCDFARAVVSHGTTTVITDPHEITNVMGTDGIEYMLEATENLPIDVHFMLPSCVPATPLDESGAVLNFEDIDEYYDHPRVLGLAEMMNYVGVINGDEEPIKKILASQSHHKKIDGHAPGLSGNELNAYITAGVYSDHECDTFENALEKLRKGQFIMIREGTAAKNLNALMPLLCAQYYSRCMFATDDKHPNDLLHGGHIDYIVRSCIKAGVDPIIAIKVASHNAARYFLMNNKGAIAGGYLADIAVVDNLEDFNILSVYKKGKLVYDGKNVSDFDEPSIDERLKYHAYHTFKTGEITKDSFKIQKSVPVIGMIDGELITKKCENASTADVDSDILKIAVVERHHGTGHIGVGFIKGYGLKKGAVATSISHDSHNIIAVGINDEDIAAAVNRIIETEGGICVVNEGKVISEVQLPVAGLMSDRPLDEVDTRLEATKKAAYDLGVNHGIDPFMTLSFMSLPVIPSIRITTNGVFDVDNWKYV